MPSNKIIIAIVVGLLIAVGMGWLFFSQPRQGSGEIDVYAKVISASSGHIADAKAMTFLKLDQSGKKFVIETKASAHPTVAIAPYTGDSDTKTIIIESEEEFDFYLPENKSIKYSGCKNLRIIYKKNGVDWSLSSFQTAGTVDVKGRTP